MEQQMMKMERNIDEEYIGNGNFQGIMETLKINNIFLSATLFLFHINIGPKIVNVLNEFKIVT